MAEPLLTTREAQIRILQGDDANRWLADPANMAAWAELGAVSPWGTVFQHRPFVAAWYRAYREHEDPVIVVDTDGDDRLGGLLLLARNRRTGVLAPAGTHHAEYQTWLARPDDAGRFIGSALPALAGLGTGGRLTFLYLAPGTPLPEPAGRHRPPVVTIVRSARRGLVTLAPGSAGRDSLRKKSNRSRPKRLERLGPLALRQLTTPGELAAELPWIAEYCDLRQGAINATTPFLSDPLKARLYLEMMAAPGLLHATVLQAGDLPLACHIGHINGREVLLGLIAHSPFHAEQSPGKLLLLMLFEQLAGQGFTRFDLTPGDDPYKDRFATSHDEVTRLECFFDPGLARRSRFRVAARRVVGQAGRMVGIAPARVRRVVRFLLDPAGWRRLRQWVWSSRESLLYRLQPDDLAAPPDALPIGTNRIADLLAYRPSGRAWPTVAEFLGDAANRLAAGQVAHTVAGAGGLSACGWMVPDAEAWPVGPGPSRPLPGRGPILLPGWTRADSGGTLPEADWLRLRIRQARRLVPAAPVYVEQDARADGRVGPTPAPGGLLIGRHRLDRRLGRARRDTTITTPLRDLEDRPTATAAAPRPHDHQAR